MGLDAQRSKLEIIFSFFFKGKYNFLKVNHFINVINHLFSYLDHELIS